MEALATFLVPILLIVLFFFIGFLRREGSGPIAVPRRESPRPRERLQLRGRPSSGGVRQARQQERERRTEADFTWDTAPTEEHLERSSRPEAAAEETARRRPEESAAQRLAPARPAPREGQRHSRPPMLATPRAAREAFLTMELLRPPMAIRESEDLNSMG